jgi:hypothetical protein
MRTAQRVLADRPELVLWAELGAAAHLAGWGTPVPEGTVLKAIRGLPSRLRDCAIAHAVDAAVAARSTAIPRTCSPGSLSGHLVNVLRDRLDGRIACSGEEASYLAVPYRWCLVVEELESAHKAGPPGAGRHPRSDEWAGQYGREIPGDTLAEQFERVSAWWERDQRDQATRGAALWGTTIPSAIETAVGLSRDDEDWAARLKEAAAELGNIDGLLGLYVTDEPSS